MRKLFKFAPLAAVIILFTAIIGRTMVTKYNGQLVNQTIATNTSFPLNLDSYGVDYLTFVTVVTSASPVSQAFTDGQLSTGTITVVSTTTGLVALSATDNFILETTPTVANLGSATLTINQTVIYFQNYIDTSSIANSAANIKAAINTLAPFVTATTGSTLGVVYTTATAAGYGTNNITMTVNVATAVVLVNGGTNANGNTSNFTGGTDPAVLSINGINVAFTVGVPTFTALSIAQAINNNTSLNTLIVATSSIGPGGAPGAIVFATSTFVGASTNYSIFTSSQTALQLVGASTVTYEGSNGAANGTFFGGQNSAYTLVSGSATLFNIATHTFVTGMQVLLTTGSSQGITGLQAGTTYYAIVPNPNQVGLALTSTGAVAGLYINFTSSQTKTTADKFTLAPLAITGVPSYSWQASNDGVTWFTYPQTTSNIAISTISFSAYVATGTVNAFDFNNYDYAWIRLNVLAPTTGAITVKATGNGKNSNQ